MSKHSVHGGEQDKDSGSPHSQQSIVPHSYIPGPPVVSEAEKAVQRIWGEMSIKERFGGDVAGIVLLTEIFKLYQVPKPTSQNSGKVVLHFFKMKDNVRVRNIYRHPVNSRWQLTNFNKCKKSILLRGVMGCCRGEAWMVLSKDVEGPLLALGWGTLTDAMYSVLENLEKSGETSLVVDVSLRNGVEARVLHQDTPQSILELLRDLSNDFHDGSKDQYPELLSHTQKISSEFSAYHVGCQVERLKLSLMFAAVCSPGPPQK